MRTGLCTLQQAMTPESETVVKQAVSLARRRGHTQVTPLHLASVMLSSSSSLLKKACLQSHSHPLQCKALELCFNVALNRLPATTASPLFITHSTLPSLSNALVAAFKRAQAHQRRGSVENQNQNQNQTVLVVRIELEQLVISILDDPSVSRVMREAGISSTMVKSRVEHLVPISSATSLLEDEFNPKPQILTLDHVPHRTRTKSVSELKFISEDITTVLDTMVGKRKNIVIVGESIRSVEAVVRGVTEKFEKGLVFGDLRYAQFLSVPLVHFKTLSKEQVERKMAELRFLVTGYLTRGVILFLGDLRWIFEYWLRNDYYRNPSIEHVVMELKRMVVDFSYKDNERKLWMMAIADSQTYGRTCSTGNPSLEAILDFHSLMIPVDDLSLSLNLSSYCGKASRDGWGWPETETVTSGERRTLHFDISLCSKIEPDQYLSSSDQNKESNGLKNPSWFLHHEDETETTSPKNQECLSVMDLCKNWNTFCSSSKANNNTQVYKQHKLNFSPLSLSSSASVSSRDHGADLKRAYLGFPLAFKTKTEDDFWAPDQISEEAIESPPKPELLSNPNSSPNSASSSEATERDVEGLNMFKELSTENLNILSDALEKKVPTHSGVIGDLARTVLRCRSGLTSKIRCKRSKREDSWLLFIGPDVESKKMIGKELAKLIFGAQSDFLVIKTDSLSSKKSVSIEEHPAKKRKIYESTSRSCLERFSEALNENPHRVFFLEDMDQYDRQGFEEAVEKGNVTLEKTRLPVPVKDAIVIFSSRSSIAASDTTETKTNEGSEEQEQTKGLSLSLDLNIAIKDEGSSDEIGVVDSVFDGKFYFGK